MNFLQDAQGNNSSTRLAFLMVVVITMGMWVFMGVSKHELVELPSTVLALIAALMGGKVLQSNIELNSPTNKGN